MSRILSIRDTRIIERQITDLSNEYGFAPILHAIQDLVQERLEDPMVKRIPAVLQAYDQFLALIIEAKKIAQEKL